MFNNVSWTGYLTTISLLLVIYYLIIGVKFYSRELEALLAPKRNPTAGIYSDTDPVSKNHEEYPITTNEESDLSASYQRFMPTFETADSLNSDWDALKLRVQQVVRDAVNNNYLKQEFILAIKQVLNEHELSKDASQIQAINGLIVSECQSYGYAQLTGDELEDLWTE